MKLLNDVVRQSLEKYLTKIANFQDYTKTRNSYGEVLETWADVDGLTGIHVTTGNKPLKDFESGEVVELRVVSLEYDLLKDVPTTYRVNIDGVTYAIMNVIKGQSEDIIEFSVKRWE